MAEISGKNVCLGGCGCGCGCVHCLTDLLGVVRIWFGIVSLIVECLYGLGGYGPSSYRTSMPPDVYTHASPAPNLFDPPKPAALPLPATVPRLRLSVSGVPCAQLCYRRPTFGGRGVRLLTPGALSVGSPPRRNAWTDLTPPAAATVSRDRVGLERREMRGSPRGGAVSCACESGAVRPRFFQTTTVKRPQWARPALGLIFGRDPGAAAVAGERPQQWSFAGWRVGKRHEH